MTMPLPNYYYPQGAYPYQQVPVMPVQQQTQNNSGIPWVQGEAGARAYPVAPNTSVLLMDSENPVMYIKTADQSGMPQPLRIFDYTERHNSPQNAPQKPCDVKEDRVTREEFERLREDVTRLSKGIRKPQIKDNKEE